MDRIIDDYDELSIVEKRISYLLGARLREKDKIRTAIEKQGSGRVIPFLRGGTAYRRSENGERLDERLGCISRSEVVCK